MGGCLPSDETFRRAWGACANVCAQGVERACELSRRATMEWSELSRSACANVCAQGGVAWSELRRCRADEAYRPAASDTSSGSCGRLLTQGRDFSARVRLRQSSLARVGGCLPRDETFRRECASDKVVWLVWEVAYPGTRLFGASAPQTK